MYALILGIVIFLGAHSAKAFPVLRDKLISSFGPNGYKGIHSVVSLLGFVLLVWGFGKYRAGGLIPVWTPPEGMRHLTLSLMWFAFVALACMNPTPGRIRGWLRHPMLVAIKIWALAHLLVNGDLGGIVLFGSFLAWAVFDRILVKRRGDVGAARVASFTGADATALIAGTMAYVAMLFLHPLLIGVQVLRM